MKEKLIILGAGVMQGPAIKIAKELGFYAIALDGSSSAPCVSMADQFEQIDLKDKERIEEFARSIQGTTNRIGIMTAGTDFSANVAWVAEKLGLPGIPYEAALNASDKSRMRECFKKAGLPSPDFTTITSDDLPLTRSPLPAPNSPFPLVIKPVDNMGSRGCRRVDSAEELNESAKAAIGFSRSGRAIVEGYMEGPEFSVDAIVYHGEITICGLADRHIFFPPYFIEMGHTMPTIIETEKQQAILDTFRAGIKALGIAGAQHIGAAKGDIKLTAKGPMIGEIAARLSGGYMSGWTYPYSSGALPIKGAILAAMGRKPEGLIPTKEWTCAERAFISIPGTVKEITGIEQARAVPNVKDLFLRIAEGSKVSFPENNVTKCGNILTVAPERADAVKAAETAARSILIKLDPSDIETDKFLADASNLRPAKSKEENVIFPPDAFQLTDEIKPALLQLPDFPAPHNNTLSNNNSAPLRLCEGAFGNKFFENNDKSSAPPHPCETLFLQPFPLFTSSNLKDYMGRTIEENLDAVRRLTGFSLPNAPKNADNIVILGRSFWSAFIRGAYQGAVYYIENLGAKWQKNTPV
ncbi:MAG: ATP-grasp domain-containing protein [Treponema sp.]|jgi:biotin carboxylase|nr:ATP-grasp domain-containing protein [Treponema sp.]